MELVSVYWKVRILNRINPVKSANSVTKADVTPLEFSSIDQMLSPISLGKKARPSTDTLQLGRFRRIFLPDITAVVEQGRVVLLMVAESKTHRLRKLGPTVLYYTYTPKYC